eukprot:371092-Pyramimonas_sp.AAC.1
MAKATGAGRADMPEWCLIVQQWELAQLHSGPFSRTESDGMRCVVRTLADERRAASPCKDKCADDVRCKRCLKYWHIDCALAIDN